MAEHLHVKYLHAGDTVSVYEVRCRPTDTCCGREEYSAEHEVVFPRTGAFVKHVAGREVVADANHVLFFNRGEPYRISHPLPGGDDCTVLGFSDAALLEVLSHYDPPARDRPDRPFRWTHGPNEARCMLRHHQLRQSLRHAETDPIAVDEYALGLLDDVVGDAYRIRGRRSPSERDDTAQAHRDVAEAAKAYLAGRFRSRLGLADVAKAVHSSPYHLARVFRRQVGMSIHQYQTRLRLATALERLADEKVTLTDLALDLGYSSHSHFSESFRRAFGIQPSGFRRSATVSRLRQMSTNLIA